MQTYYVVQTYSVNQTRKIQADEPRLVQSRAEAMRLAERMSETKFGVIAFSRTGDAQNGDWNDAEVLYEFGDYTAEDADALRSAA